MDVFEKETIARLPRLAPPRPVCLSRFAQFPPESLREFIIGIGAYFGGTSTLSNQRYIFFPDRTEQDDAGYRHRFFKQDTPAFRSISANVIHDEAQGTVFRGAERADQLAQRWNIRRAQTTNSKPPHRMAQYISGFPHQSGFAGPRRADDQRGPTLFNAFHQCRSASGPLGYQSRRNVAGFYINPEIEVRVIEGGEEIDRFADTIPEGVFDRVNVDSGQDIAD
ncbi:hypothetical protein Rru_A1707 [Rhodospirillum rubrum ATCC 11170]|uniref:Uncharacterized protein n=1 Tax=Rhodospirillum rubrum (strain ATCC 11170 / ATH 1.1.1 / DSM 467 / LMG 4362 / NCIMB 8255 / S1) TaxID=269796 RepID=Q2RTN8_RHORT|nr:hypothetical protein Rru_A1707 [Rhodospirillum rubrum ATCC 11170]MBK5954094.1 hypothetical protein [Rhodospirillum rubrum]HAP99879.1 hypothetical protein [Rhodospirillum rubrum]HCF18708.1 hypothetical protein [Rhodospirillum rubrum]